MRQLIKEAFQQDLKKSCYSYFLNFVIKKNEALAMMRRRRL